jgi:hypothetical protein
MINDRLWTLYSFLLRGIFSFSFTFHLLKAYDEHNHFKASIFLRQWIPTKIDIKKIWVEKFSGRIKFLINWWKTCIFSWYTWLRKGSSNFKNDLFQIHRFEKISFNFSSKNASLLFKIILLERSMK